jgi:hypothetical protein
MYSTALPNTFMGSGLGDAANIVHAGYTTSTGTTFSLSCVRGSGTTNVYVNNPTLSAIKVGALH